MTVFKQMLVFLVMIFLGVAAGKCRIISGENQGQFSALVIKITCPCLILASATGGSAQRIAGGELANTLGVLVLLLALVLLLSKILPTIMRYEKKDKDIVNVMGWCTNITFIGLPLVQSLYGNQAVIYVTFAIMMINTLFYSYGVILVGNSTEKRQAFRWKSLINPGMIACVLACACYFLNISLPGFLLTALTMVGNLTAPLAMMIIGVGLLDIRPKEVLTDVRLLLFAIIKMLVVPILLLYLVRHVTDNIYLLATCMAVVASPTGGMVAMLATLYNPEAYIMVTKEISLTTLLSVITIPIVAAIGIY